MKEQEKPFISVIIPVFNAKQYLPACVDSVLRQTYTNYEILLIDDGSTDESGAICDKYADKSADISVFHQKNSGVSAARNTGIHHAKGDYLTFLDCDDTLLPNALELLLRDAQEYHADIVSAVKCSVGLDGTVFNPYEDAEIRLYEGEEPLCLSLAYESQTHSVCAKLFRKDFLADTRFVAGRNIHEDGFFLFECYAKKPKLLQHNVCVYQYYVRNDSASRGGFSEKYLDMLYFCEEKRKIVQDEFPHLTKNLMNTQIVTRLLFLEILCRTDDPKYKSVQKDSVRFVRKHYRDCRMNRAHERRMARIVAYGLYPIYKALVRKKHHYTS